jgi:MoaA/NifB/PqqE/SkfB family radical SAM enzyme
MEFLRKITYIPAIFRAIVFKKRIPLLVSWAITNRCNARCAYCNVWDAPSRELDTGEILSMIDDLKLLGTKRFHFTGGEPLLRDDIGTILEHCRKNGLSTSMNSNGSLVSQKVNEIVSLSLLRISLDGPEEAHDYVRGAHSYREAIRGISVAKNKGIKVWLVTVLSKYNLHAIDFLLEKAKEFDAPILFQPATELLLGGNMKNPTMPEAEEYRRTIKALIAKKRTTKYIANSISGLEFLYEWPEMKKIHCLANLISCRIESDGRIRTCFRNQNQTQKAAGNDFSLKDAFLGLPSALCDRCDCASTLEINCVLSFKLDAIMNSCYYYL